MALTYDDVLLVPQYSEVKSRADISLKTQITPSLVLDFPLISVNMETVTGVEMACAMSSYGGIGFYPRFSHPEVQVEEVKKVLDHGCQVVPAVGIKPSEYERVKLLYKIGIRVVTIDVAHGHLLTSLQFLKKIKHDFAGLEVIAGVIATYEGARDLFKNGADAVRVGVGPGTICTTRQVTGSGVPQITATMEAYRAAKEFKKPILTDGGTKTTGDIMKALAAGASAVVTGSQLAGTDEAPGKLHIIDGQQFKSYNGSTSQTEKTKQLDKYAVDKANSYTEFVEGVEAFVPYKGPVKSVLSRIEKGIRSGMSYSGACTIKELHKKAQFIRVTPNSVAENGHHGVHIF